MPDITMCVAKKCYLSDRCYRSEDSGTTPTEDRQSWCDFSNDSTVINCPHYLWIPKGKKNDKGNPN